MLLSNENPTGVLYFIKGLTGYDGDIPAFIPEKYFLNVNFEAL